MKSKSDKSTQAPAQAGGKRIPEQRRDCGPQVDTWPILDTQIGDAPKPKTDEYGRPKGPAEP
jgi:hypothetical protein